MRIFINGEEQETSENRLGAVLAGIEGLPETFACAVNGRIVPKSKHADFALCEGDKIEIFALMAGG